MFTVQPRLTLKLLGAGVLIASFGTAAQATTFTFETDPFAGTTALQMLGRQVVANEQFIPQINVATDAFAVSRGRVSEFQVIVLRRG